jgi:hypothetical protein
MTVVLLVLLAGCSGSPSEQSGSAAADESTGQPADDQPSDQADHGEHGTTAAPASSPLRKGESFVDLEMPGPYTPKAPTYGTDDYRCFLLDPGLAKRSYVTGVDVLPGRPELVHHVILFRVPPGQVAAAKAKDADEEGQGWTCFGGTGLSTGVGDQLDGAPWLGAWAPGAANA